MSKSVSKPRRYPKARRAEHVYPGGHPNLYAAAILKASYMLEEKGQDGDWPELLRFLADLVLSNDYVRETLWVAIDEVDDPEMFTRREVELAIWAWQNKAAGMFDDLLDKADKEILNLKGVDSREARERAESLELFRAGIDRAGRAFESYSDEKEPVRDAVERASELYHEEKKEEK